jgi:hypothetical protein
MNMQKMAGWTFAVMVGTGLALAAPGARAQTDVGKEVSTAATHAGLAAGSKELPQVQMHLHHVINCLVGSAGKGFDTTVANPCKDQGAGAIPDTKTTAGKKKLRLALAKANTGLKSKTLAAAQKNATQAQDLLKTAM